MFKIANQTHFYKAYARELVESLKLIQTEHEYRIQIDDCSITLCSELNNQIACFTHSFLEPRLIKRATQKNQGLFKACSNKKNTIRNICDLTAGWGKDSYLLASQGRNVQMLEYNPMIYYCLNYLLKSAADESNSQEFQRMSLKLLDSYSYLKQGNHEEIDCFYLDPMFPAHKSSARPSKDLQLLQRITQNQSIQQTFQLALSAGVQRVVVKRPLHAAFLDELKPDISYREKTIRFDVYLG